MFFDSEKRKAGELRNGKEGSNLKTKQKNKTVMYLQWKSKEHRYSTKINMHVHTDSKE